MHVKFLSIRPIISHTKIAAITLKTYVGSSRAYFLDKSKPSMKVFGFVAETLPATLNSFCTIVFMIIINHVKRPVPFLLAYNYGYLYQKV